MTELVPIVWHFRVSHYNEKVRWALDYKGLPHIRRTLIPGFHLPVARWISGQNMLPIIRLGDEVIAGSNHVLLELERRWPEPRLFPQDPVQLQRALDIQAYFDEQVAPELRRLFWSTYINDSAQCARMATDGASAATRAIWQWAFPLTRPLFRKNMGINPGLLASARTRMSGHFDRLQREIGPSGYLVGEQFSVADLTAAAVMTAIIRPPEFPYPLPEPWPEELVAMRQSVARHPAFQWVMDIYTKHRSPSREVTA